MNKCKNCGGWKGLHHFQTNQCPRGGVESPIGRPQEWQASTYEEDNSEELATMRAEIAEMKKQLKALNAKRRRL